MNPTGDDTVWRRIRQFSTIWQSKLPAEHDDKHHALLFGIRNRLVLFVALLIATALLISGRKTSTTLNYVVDREKVDLQDESKNAKLSIELALQTAYSQLVICEQIVTGKCGTEVQLSPLDAKQGISRAYVDKLISAKEVRSYVFAPAKFGTQQIENMVGTNSTCWSEIYWENFGTSATAHVQVLIPESHIAYASLYNPGASPHDEFDPPNRDVDSGKRFWLVRFDLTEMLSYFTNGARVLVYFLNQDASELKLGPNGCPVLATVAKNRVGDDVIGTAKVPTKLNKESSKGVARATQIPTHVSAAVHSAMDEFQASENYLQRFSLYRPPKSSYWTFEGASISEMLADPASQTKFSLVYSETRNLDPSVSTQLETDELERIEAMLRHEDPFVRIDPLNPEVGELRIRASDADYLSLTKGFLEKSIAVGAQATKVKWNDIKMDNFVLCVERVELPAVGNQKDAFLGYLVRSTALTEIKQSASRDLDNLNRYTLLASIAALAMTLVVANYLTAPLSRMTRVAQRLSEIGFKANEQDQRQIGRLLSELPTSRRDEVGLLATQFEKTSRDLMKANSEVKQKADDVVAKQRKYEQSEREKAIAAKMSQDRVQLLATVSHDMRQPLLPIFHHAEYLLKSDTVSETDKRRISSIVKNANELNFLIEDILDFKRILAGDIQISVESVDLDVLLDELMAHYEDHAKQRKLVLVKNNMWPGELQTDALRLKRVLNNLVSNAVKATQAGEVRLTVSPLGVDHVEISITDTGCGMDELQQRLVFEPAERRAEIERKSRTVTKSKDSNSTGLGLFISKQLVTAMGGDIRFESKPGKGTRFIVKLPVAVPSRENNALANPDQDSRTSHGRLTQSSNHKLAINTPAIVRATEGSSRVLVVDDDPRCTTILSEMLQELGYQVEIVHDGESALERVAIARPDLVTMDVQMPGIDGWETLRLLKSDEATAAIPVIMVTVYPDESRATFLGASGIVSKPIEHEAFNQAVLSAIGTQQGARVLVVDDDSECLTQVEELLAPLGFKVILAHDGVEAISKIDALGMEKVDLAIIDLYMPNMDGFGLIEKLCQMPHTEDIPIIVLSAGLLSESERANLEPHVAKFFSKGAVDFATLRNEISRLLAKYRNEGHYAV